MKREIILDSIVAAGQAAAQITEKVTDVFKYKLENDRAKEQNRHESEKHKEKLIEKNNENTQKTLEKAQEREQAAIQRHNDTMEARVNEAKEHSHYIEKTLEKRIADNQSHMNELMACQEKAFNDIYHHLNAIHEQKDELFNNITSTLNNITDDGIDSFNEHLSHISFLNQIKESKQEISNKNSQIHDEIILIKNNISRLNNKLIKEETRYDQLTELKSSLTNNDYKIKLSELSNSMLSIASKINNAEIDLLKKKNEKNNSDEKLKFINNAHQAIKRKEFDALSSIKASFYAQKKINN